MIHPDKVTDPIDELAAANRIIAKMHWALQGLLAECGLAGLADSDDFNWPIVVKAARDALALVEQRK